MKQNFRHSYFTLDLEDFCFDFQRSLGIAEPESRPKSILKSLDRVNQILSQSKIDNFTNFVTGQVAILHQMWPHMPGESLVKLVTQTADKIWDLNVGTSLSVNGYSIAMAGKSRAGNIMLGGE